MQEMEGTENGNQRDEVFSKSVRAGKRTYFFDVKATRSNDYYLTITESKRKFNQENGKFYYEKHKLFLYKEDFEKFSEGLQEAINKIIELKKEQGEEVVEKIHEPKSDENSSANNEENNSSSEGASDFTNVDFDDI
tara:strand:- start:139347 stop:139754 length:408 start_codon:yes stop_codon:yes gene_type:complete